MKERTLDPLKIGITYNVKREVQQAGSDNDAEAEFDSPFTVAAIHSAIASLGHQVVDLEANKELPVRLASAGVDIVFNIAEGIQGRNREAQVPALLDMLEIPYSGSDSTALTLTHDKNLSKKVVAEAGVATPAAILMHSAVQEIPANLTYPVIVKPVAEGSSKGIFTSSVVHNAQALKQAVAESIRRYHQPALVETFVGGREFTVGILEDDDIEVLPPMEIVFLQKEDCSIYSYQYKLEWEKYLRYDTSPKLSLAQKKQLKDFARKSFIALGCRDVARMDFRMDHAGDLYFLECNALPGLAPDWSDLCFIATGAGMSYQQLIERIITPALKRVKRKTFALS